MNILDSLRRVREKFESLTGLEPRELVANGKTLIEAYRRGILSPNDRSIKVIIPDSDLPMVQDFLKTWDGKIE
jgi:hypothetical protein